MNFCSHCGQPVELKTPPGDHVARHICAACGTIHYQNPKIVVGCVPEHEGRILICRRAIDPRHGYWTIPAGFMENGETLEQGAARECYEEALAKVTIGSLLLVANIVSAHQVHVFFRAHLTSPEFGPGPESLETRLVDPADIPWSDIAFPSTEFALRHYLEDRAAGVEPHHLASLARRP